jgi:Tfp pilus assembly major pilin PilA
MRLWAIWAVQTTFPKDEVWFSLLQLLIVTALLATLVLLAVSHVLVRHQMKSWATWAVQAVFSKDETWFSLLQLLTVTVFLATLALLAVPHVLSLRQKGRVVTLTAETSPVQYAGPDLGLTGRGALARYRWTPRGTCFTIPLRRHTA